MNLSELKPNPNNPRVIKDERFKKLVNSIKEFPKMMRLRPIVVDDDNMILGGNMRLRALQELNYTEIPDEWVARASDLTEEERKRFIIVDNVGFGENDLDMLANEWDLDELNNWGLFIPNIEKINELEEWNKAGMPEFEVPDNVIGIHIQFNTDEEREVYAKDHNLIKDYSRKNIWIIKPNGN